MSTTYRMLTPVKDMIESLGFAMSYPYDDLIFVDSNAFLIQFDDSKDNSFFIYFNVEMDESSAKALLTRFLNYAASKKLSLTPKGKFELAQKEGDSEEIEIKFS